MGFREGCGRRGAPVGRQTIQSARCPPFKRREGWGSPQALEIIFSAKGLGQPTSSLFHFQNKAVFLVDISPSGSIMSGHTASPKSSSTFGKCCTPPEARGPGSWEPTRLKD